MITTYLMDIRLLTDPLECEEALTALPKGRVEKIRRQKHLQTRKQSFGAGILLDYGLRQAMESGRGRGLEEKKDIRELLSCNPFGCPICKNIPFNLSHAGDYVILSIALGGGTDHLKGQENGQNSVNMQQDPGVLIGCDIEQIKDYRPETARRFFTAREVDSLSAQADAKKQARLFYRYWTRKESVLKLTGLGLLLPMDLFDVTDEKQPLPDAAGIEKWYDLADGKHKPYYRKAKELLLNTQLFFKAYEKDGYCISICSTIDRFTQEISVKKACIDGHVVIS